METHAALIVLVALLASPAHADVLVVDAAGGPGANFTELQPAIDAAADGDLLLVRTGTYLGFTIDGKSLSVVADAGATVDIGPTLLSVSYVLNLAAGQSVLLHGLSFDSGWPVYGMDPFVGSTLTLRDAAGAIWLEDCDVKGGRPSLLVHACADVTLAGCTLVGWPNYGVGCWVQGGSVAIVNSTLTGTDGQDASVSWIYQVPAMAGGDALGVFPNIPDSNVTLMGCTLQGGSGGNGYQFQSVYCLPPADGGDGVHVWGAEHAFVSHVDCTMLGGAAGNAVECAPAAQPGQALGGDGLVLPLPGTTPRLESLPPVREGGVIVLTLSGTPGDGAFLLLSAAPGGAFLPSKGGDLLLGGSASLLPLGMVPHGGTLTLAAHAPLLGPAVQDAVVFLQCASCGPAGPCALGTGTVVVVLAAGL